MQQTTSITDWIAPFDGTPRMMHIGPHEMIRHNERCTIVRYHGDVQADHVRTMVEAMERLPTYAHAVIMTDTADMGRFDNEARRVLASMRPTQLATEMILTPTAGANALRRAAMTIALTAARLASKMKTEAPFIFDYDECVRYCEQWLEAHPA